MDYPVLSETPLDRDTIEDERVDVLRFLEFARERWIVVALACIVAAGIALTVSLFLPKKYTATASLLIEPPAGNDPRGATAISPIYLESLKTYERFASSNTLFARALDRLRLRPKYSGSSIESIKNQVLHVAKPRDTKILEISATLLNPADAQALARYLAEQTVQLSGSLDRQSQLDLTAQVREQFEAATARFNKAEKARDAFLISDPIETLEAEIRNGTEQKLRLQNELTEAHIDLADYEARLQSRTGADSDLRETALMREQLVASRARTARIEKEDRDLGQVIASKGALFERRKHQRDVLDNERQSARVQYELASNRQNDTLASAAFRSERLEIIDPGTMPEKPSSPNIALNVLAALFVAFIGSCFYLAVQFSRASSLALPYAREFRASR